MQDARGRSTRSSKRFDPVPDPPPPPDQGDTGEYICIECSETFYTKLELNSHRQSHVTPKQFICTHCGRGFHHQVFLEMHERSHEDMMSHAPVTRTPGRIISTRSSKAASSLTAEVVNVPPPPPKQPGQLVNSAVDFRRERKVVPAFTPIECVTRRSPGAPQLPCQRRDPTEKKNRFELRIAKVSDTTIHLIDPFGNTIEILSEVFNKYTIGDSEEDPSVRDVTAEDAGAQESSTALEMSDDGPQDVSPESLVPQAEVSETGDIDDDTEMEEDLSSSPSISADVPPTPVSSISDKDGGSPDHEHSMIQRNSDIPKSSAEGEIAEPVVQNDSLLNDQTEEMVEPNHEMETDSKTKASDGSLVEDATLPESNVVSAETVALRENSKLDVVEERHSTTRVGLLDQEEDPSLLQKEIPCTERDPSLIQKDIPCTERDPSLLQKEIPCMEREIPCTERDPSLLQKEIPCIERDPSLIQKDIPCMESESLTHEMPDPDIQVQGLQEESTQQPLLNDATEKGIGFLLNMNSDHDQLNALCDDDTTNPSTKFDMSLSGWEALSRRVNHGQILDQLSDTETSDLGESKAAESVDEETVTALEDQRSPGKQEADNTLSELNLNAGQGQSSSEDLDYVCNRKTEEKVSSENFPGEPNLALSNSEESSMKDGGNQDTEESSDHETLPAKDVYDKTTPEGEQNMDFVAQGICAKASIFTVESCVSPPETNSLPQMGHSDGEKKTASVVEDENFLIEQMDTDLSERDERDLFDGRDILPLDAQVEVGDKIHINDSNIVFEKEMDNNIVAHKPAMDQCLTEHNKLSENTIISPIEEDTQEKTKTEDTIVETDIEHASLENNNPLERGDFSMQNEQLDICNHQDSGFSPTCQDAESKIHPADMHTDLSLEDNAEYTERSLSPHVPSTALVSSAILLPSKRSEVADVQEDTAPSVATLSQNSVIEDISMQVTAPGLDSDAETFLSNIKDTGESRTLKDEDGSVSVHDNQCKTNADTIHLIEGSSMNGDMMKVSDEESTSFPHSSSLQTDATCDVEAETNGKIESGGGSPSPHNEVCLSMTIDKAEEISDDLSSPTREDEENIFPEQNPVIEKPTHESCTLQNMELNGNDEDTNTVSSGSTDINEQIVHKLISERDLRSDRLKCDGNELSVEKALCPETDSKSSDYVLESDSGGTQDKNNDLNESLTCEHLEDTQNSELSIVDLNESQESDQRKRAEEKSLDDTGANSEEPIPCEGASLHEPTNENISTGDGTHILSETPAAVSPSQAVSRDGTLDGPEVLLLPDGVVEEPTEIKATDGSLGESRQCLNCGRKLRRSRNEIMGSPSCFKCRLVAKRQKRLSNKGLCKNPDVETDMAGKEGNVSLLSDFQIKQEANKEDVSVNLMKPSVSGDEQEVEPVSKKSYKCHKCDKSFRIPALLAGHMKYHTLPHCLSCGCQMKLKYKTRRIPRRCQKCVQEIKDRKKDLQNIDEKSEDEESLKSDSETLVSDNQSEVPEGDLSDSELALTSLKPLKKRNTKLKAQPVGVGRGSERVHSVLLKKCRKAKQGLYCMCPTPRMPAYRQAIKKCQHCQKLIRGQKTNPLRVEKEELIGQKDGWLSDVSHDSDHDLKSKLKIETTQDKKRPLKKMKKQPSPGSETVLGENTETLGGDTMAESEVVSCKKEDSESSSDEQVISDMTLPDGEKPRLCLQCGKAFKCNRSLNLHLLSHNAVRCELCGCRLQKKRRGGRWSKQCRICRLRSKDESVSADDTGDNITSDTCVTSLPLKVKQPKIVKKRKIQTIAKQKREQKRVNMMLAVKGLKRKRELKSLHRPSSEPDDSGPSVIDAKSSILTGLTPLPNYDGDLSMQQPGPSGLHYSPKKQGRKCLYREKNIIKVEENQLLHNPAVSIKQEEENQCLECNQNFPNFDLLLLHQQSHVEGQPYSCSECPQTFSKEQYLSIHQNSHPEDRPFRCPECNKTFTRRNHLGVHRRVHSGLRPFACPDCPCKFRQKGSLIIHRYTHRNTQVLLLKPYQCSVCSKSFKQKERLIVHERLHTGECPFSCKDCDQVFPSKARLYMHRKMHKTSEGSSGVEPCLGSKEDVAIHSFQCQDCDKVCSTKASFVLHRKVHRPSLPSSKQNIDHQNLEEHPFHCRKCNKVFSTKASLTLHMKLHVKAEIRGKPFICKDCNEVCPTKVSLVLHRRVHKTLPIFEKKLDIKVEDGSQPFPCKHCGKLFSTKASLVHHRRVHKTQVMYEQNPDIKAAVGSHPFMCQHCDKVCSTKASFVLHSKVHRLAVHEDLLKTSVVPQTYNCKECDVVCSTKASFVLHSKIHKSSSSEQNVKAGPFICKYCDKVCSTKGSLGNHRKVHRSLSNYEQSLEPRDDLTERPFECKDCGKIFFSQEQLSTHSKVHAQAEVSPNSDLNTSNKVDVEEPQKTDIQEKPFACPTCPMRFTRLKILVRHKLLHGEEGIFSCVHCGKRFLFQKSLLNHGKICQDRNKGKSPLRQKKVATKRKSMKDLGDSGLAEESVLKKRKTIEKKAMFDAQKEKKKKLLKAKKLAMIKEKSKIKTLKEKKKLKEMKAKPGVESDSDTTQGKQEKPLDFLAKEKKTKDVSKGNKVKKITLTEKQQKGKSVSLKKWKLIASSAVQKRKLQATINVGKKKAEVKKRGPVKARAGGKEKP